MKTDDLIGALVVDVAVPPPSPARALAFALLAGAVVSTGVFVLALGPRPDVAQAMTTPRFLWKFAESAALAGAALVLALAMLRPTGDRRPGRAALAVVGAAVVATVAIEAMVVPVGEWSARLLGHNWLHCLILVPLLALPPFALAMWAARDGAPTDPGRAGAVIGLLSGGIGAFLYAANCTDDSPFFVATWYTLAILALAGLGGLVGRRLLAW